MKHFVIYNSAGDILQTGTCPEEVLELQADPDKDRFVMVGQANPLYERVVSGQIVPKQVTEAVLPQNDNTYRLLRSLAYPSLKDFADAVYWQSKGDDVPMTRYLAACDKVKQDFPKPNVSQE